VATAGPVPAGVLRWEPFVFWSEPGPEPTEQAVSTNAAAKAVAVARIGRLT
jgi:hypothetical protein